MIIHRRQFLQTAAALSPMLLPARMGDITFGAVKPANEFQDAVKAGFDYFEPPAFEIAAMSDAEFEAYKKMVLASPIRCTRLNFLIQKLKVVGPDANMDALQKYVELTLDRSKQLGGTIVVWGSAISRNVPEGFSRDRAYEQINAFLKMSDPIARSKNIILAVEPIRKSSSNILSTGAETLKLVRALNLPNVKMMIDFFQMRSMNESPDIIWEARKEIVHVHYANYQPHDWPKSPDEDPETKHFFALLKKMNYRGGISVEAPGPILEHAPAMFAFFKEVLA